VGGTEISKAMISLLSRGGLDELPKYQRSTGQTDPSKLTTEISNQTTSQG
jgi:hypothetical protein